MDQGERSASRHLEKGVREPSGLLTLRPTPGLALGHLWAPDRLGTAPSPRDLGPDLVPPPQCADWLNLPCAPPPTRNQAVVTMATGRAAASLVAPGRGKGGRKGTKVPSWIWAGVNPTSSNTKRGAGAKLPVAKCNLPPFSGLRSWGREIFLCLEGGKGKEGLSV